MRVLTDRPSTHRGLAETANDESATLEEQVGKKRVRKAPQQAQTDVLGALELWSQAVSASAELMDR